MGLDGYFYDLDRSSKNHPYDFVFHKNVDSNNVKVQRSLDTNIPISTFQETEKMGYSPKAPHPVISSILDYVSSFDDRKPDTIKSRQAGESFRAQGRQCRVVRRQRCRRPSNQATSKVFLAEILKYMGFITYYTEGKFKCSVFWTCTILWNFAKFCKTIQPQKTSQFIL